MGAIKPWHLLTCLVFVVAVVGALAAVIRSGRQK